MTINNSSPTKLKGAFLITVLIAVVEISHYILQADTLNFDVVDTSFNNSARPSIAPTNSYEPSPAVQRYLKLKPELERRLRKATEKKIILVWIPMFGSNDPVSIPADQCGNCDVTYDRSKIESSSTGAVVFHFDALKKNDMPSKRNPKHLYIYWVLESTATLKNARGRNLNLENSLHFNATMTYRGDSDFYMSYSSTVSIRKTIESEGWTPEKVMKEKSKFAVALVSNCGSTSGASKRMEILRNIQNIENRRIEFYGHCFSRGKMDLNEGFNISSYNQKLRKYKFFFSFENSFHCKDYITEKFYRNALASISVPVVWGAPKEDYENVAPSGSYIHVDDFSSVKDLVDYLIYLDQNDTAYLKYFRWLTMDLKLIPQYGRAISFCQICRALHGINIDDIFNPKYNESNPERPLFTDEVSIRTVENLKSWLYDEENEECFHTMSHNALIIRFLLYILVFGIYLGFITPSNCSKARTKQILWRCVGQQKTVILNHPFLQLVSSRLHQLFSE